MGGINENYRRKLTIGDVRRANLPERYWEASLNVIPDRLDYKHKIEKYLANLVEMMDQGIGLYLWSAENGTGKAQPLHAKVLTDKGFVPIGSIRIGDKVFTEDGTLTEVIGVYPQGLKDNFKVTLLDGRSTECCNEHLWSVYVGTGASLKTVSLQHIMDSGLRSDSGKTYKFFVPNNGRILFSERTDLLPIDPYVLGVLLGDGCLSSKINSVEFSTPELDIVERMKYKLGPEYKIVKRKSNNYSWGITYESANGKNPLLDHLRNLGLRVLSKDKFIPESYLFSSVESRMELLYGLFDTDGSVRKNGSYSYSTSSPRLANDFAFLCRSLGYQAVVKEFDRGTRGIEYEVTVLTHERIFTTKKHGSRYHVGTGKNVSKYKKTAIKDISYLGKEEMVCIKVASKSQLYLTDDFIVTHNTSIASLIAKEALRYGKTVFFEESSRLKGMLINKEQFEEGTSIEARMMMVDVLILDDVGKEYRTSSGYAENVIETLVRARVQKVKTTIMTGNVHPKDMQKIYSEDFSALLKESVVPVNVTGHDFREARAKALSKLL
jgi:hypothetical protein